MSKPILAGYDAGASDLTPVELGAELARLTGAPLVVVSVHAGTPVFPVGTPQNDVDYAIGQVDPELALDIVPALENLEPQLRALGVRYEVRPVPSTSAARGLQAEAERSEAGLLVVGSSRHAGVGSTAARVLHGSPCSVAVAPGDWKAVDWSGDGRPDTVGVGWVESDEGRHALQSAYALARHLGATLRVISVVRESLRMNLESEPRYVAGQFGKDTEDVEGEYMFEVERRLRATVDELGHDVRVEIDTLAGDPADMLADLSRRVDILICGSRGYGPLRGVLLGSVTRRLIAEAHSPLIVVPRGVKRSLEALLEHVLQADRR
jgi:nucleotide-binding universal stress UspA family protein